MTPESRAAVVAALVGSGALAALKAVAAVATGSAAMLAEACHSVVEAGNRALRVLGMRRPRRSVDRGHRLGHGHDVHFRSFVVAVMLFTLGGGFAIWEGVRQYLHPSEPQSLGWAYGVLAAGFVFKVVSLGVAIRSLLRAKSGRTLAELWHDTRGRTMRTVVCEDAAAVTSLAIAATGIALAHWTGHPVWDALASALIGLVLIGVAVFLTVQNYSLLLGERAPDDVERAIDRIIDAADGVRTVRAVRTMHLGPDAVFIVASVEFERRLDAAAVEKAAAGIRACLVDRLYGMTDSHLVVVDPAPVPPAR